MPRESPACDISVCAALLCLRRWQIEGFVRRRSSRHELNVSKRQRRRDAPMTYAKTPVTTLAPSVDGGPSCPPVSNARIHRVSAMSRRRANSAAPIAERPKLQDIWKANANADTPHARGVRKKTRMGRQVETAKPQSSLRPCQCHHAAFGKSSTVSLTRLNMLVNRIALTARMASRICRSL